MRGSVRQNSETTSENTRKGTAPWVAVLLIGVLLLCCLTVVGTALLDELIPAHPLRTMLVGTRAPPSTHTPAPTSTPTDTPVSTPTRAPTPQPTQDAFEPDDTMAQANEIETDGDSQSHTLSPAGDRDYVSFQARAGLQYTIETGNLGDGCDTLVTLHDDDGTVLATDDDGADEPLASRLTWVSDETGIFLVEIANLHEDTQGDTHYEIWVLESEPVTFEEDEYEPDDTMGQAREILLDAPQTHFMHLAGDHDWVFFQAEENVTYVIETFDLDSDIDTVIHLYHADGQQLAQDDDGGEENLASRIIWRADSAGLLYVMVRNYREDVAGPGTHYSISVAQGAPLEGDAYEPDDTQNEAVEIEIGQHQDHNLHVTGDHDWVYFPALAQTTYVIETFNLGSSIDTMITLYDAGGQELISDDDGGDEALASRITWSASEDGVFYVMVRDLSDSNVGPGTNYVLSVREEGSVPLLPDAYEPDDTMAEAGEIESGETQIHNIHAPGDHDWLVFEAAQDTTYILETFNLGQEGDTIIFLYDASGEELAQDDDGAEEPRASRITWTAGHDGPLYIMVRDYKDNRAERDMGYSVSIRTQVTASGETRVYIADGAYHILAHQTNSFVVGVTQQLSLENFVLEADAAQVSGDDDNEYGLVYGYQDDDNYYEVAISGDGYAGFFAKERGAWRTVVTFTADESINQGNAVNHLRLEVHEGRSSFQINGQPAFEEFDDHFAEGLIGFGCGPFAQPGLHCSFDNVKVWNEEGDLIWEEDFDDNSGDWFEGPVG